MATLKLGTINTRRLRQESIAKRLGISESSVTPQLTNNSHPAFIGFDPFILKVKQDRLLKAAQGESPYRDTAIANAEQYERHFGRPLYPAGHYDAYIEQAAKQFQQFDVDDVLRADRHRLATGGGAFLLQKFTSGERLRVTKKARISRQTGGATRTLRIAR